LVFYQRVRLLPDPDCNGQKSRQASDSQWFPKIKGWRYDDIVYQENLSGYAECGSVEKIDEILEIWYAFT
jgi:hypothetical protein